MMAFIDACKPLKLCYVKKMAAFARFEAKSGI